MSKPNNPFLKEDGTKCTCMDMLQQMLDSEVTNEQRDYFKQHLDNCMPCYKTYDLEMTIKELLKSKCCGGDVPPDLIIELQAQINQKIST
ncbi:MAG: mycothiol system anti-sigma-R factor [Bacteroidia bacterium]|nr:mycothiol system anti-sigma-R factor [Bacteroidia bacterium]